MLFAGSLNGIVKALRASDGAELWSYQTAVAVTDVDGEVGKGGTSDLVGPIPVGKELFVNSGYATFGGTNAFQAGESRRFFCVTQPTDSHRRSAHTRFREL